MSFPHYSCLNNSYNIKEFIPQKIKNLFSNALSEIQPRQKAEAYAGQHESKDDQLDYSFEKNDSRGVEFSGEGGRDLKVSEDKRSLKASENSFENLTEETLEKGEKLIVCESEFMDLSEYVILEQGDSKPLSESEWEKLAHKEKNLTDYSYSRISRSLQQGIPFHLRRNIWTILADVENLKKKKYSYFKYNDEKNRANPKLEKIIKWDVFRTKSFHNYFNSSEKETQLSDGLEILKRVLTAYSHFDNELGYTQGMNFIAGLLLIYLNLENDPSISKDYDVIDNNFEENSFWILVHMMMELGWREVLKINTPVFEEILNSVDDKIKQFLPDVHKHITSRELTIQLCFTQEIMTIFLLSSPREIAKRILDIFLYEGRKSIYMIMMRLLQICHDDILSIKDPEALKDFLKFKLVARAFEKFNVRNIEVCMADWYEPLDLNNIKDT